MAVYAGDNPEWVRQSVESMENQTVAPTQFVIVRDGPVSSELDEILDSYSRRGYHVERLETNGGLARALTKGLPLCSTPFVARMDADDVALPTRMEEQLEMFRKWPSLALAGCSYTQYDDDLRTQVGIRSLPEAPSEIRRLAVRRTPINHVTVVMRRDVAMAVGGYSGAALYFEDWWLVWRFLSGGHEVRNLSRALVDVRGGDAFVARRHGLAYARYEWRNLVGLRAEGHITLIEMLGTALYRIPPRLLPRRVLNFLYERFLR